MEDKKLTADEMEKELLKNTDEAIDHIRKEEDEILNRIESEINDLTRIHKEDELGF